MKFARRAGEFPLPSFSFLLLVLLPSGPAPALGHAAVELDDQYPILRPPETRYPPPATLMRCELRKPTDYPVGLYLGPSRLTASYYNEDDQAVATLASVPASPAWRNYTEDVVRDRGRWGWDCEADMTCSNATATLFADAMAAILDASESALGHAPIVGYVVLPHNTSELTGLFDMVLHHDFPCYQWARHGDYIEYDIIRPAQAVQYAYHDQMPWGQSDDTGEEDAFVLLANLEPGFLELAGVCPKDVDVCRTSELAARAWPALGEDALWPPAMRSNTTSDDRASPSARFGQAVRRLADAVAAYVTAAATEPECNGHVRGVVVAGAASEQAMAALRIALHDVLPYANDTPFYDTVDPASVFSLDAAVLGRNTQLADERGDCACMVDEALRRPEGSPLDDAFPCNRTMAHLDSIY